MGKLIRKILGNVAGAVGAITFSDWNGQTVIKAKSEGSTASIRSGGTSALAVHRLRFSDGAIGGNLLFFYNLWVTL